MSIYTNQNCFVYKWTQLSTNKWYIGSRTAKNCHLNDGYTCSSKIVKPLILQNPNDWIRVILETGSRVDILQLEHELLKCLNAAQSEFSYNLSNGAGTFSNSGNIASVKTCALISVKAKRPRKAMSLSHRDAISKSKTGKIRGTQPDAHRAKISKAFKNKSQRLVTCPHCNKIGGAPGMKRYHLDNCKLLSTTMI